MKIIDIVEQWLVDSLKNFCKFQRGFAYHTEYIWIYIDDINTCTIMYSDGKLHIFQSFPKSGVLSLSPFSSTFFKDLEEIICDYDLNIRQKQSQKELTNSGHDTDRSP